MHILPGLVHRTKRVHKASSCKKQAKALAFTAPEAPEFIAKHSQNDLAQTLHQSLPRPATVMH
jgi:hypothetical protein